MAEQALSDVRVIDLTHYIAGPYCTKMMADLGAEVIKVERPEGGDPCRRLGPFLGDEAHPEKSGLFLHLNTNKKSLTLNLGTKTGVKILKELVKGADILVENYAPGTMESWGLGYEELERLNPRLVMTSISNFGQNGPYRDYKASEIVVYAMSGGMHHTGVPEREPTKLGVTVVQIQTGSVAAVFTMGAFFAARYQGIGQHLDFSLVDAQRGTIDRGGTFILTYLYSGYLTPRSWSTSRTLMPVGMYPCKDGFVNFSAFHPQWWPRFANMLERPDLITDPRFVDVMNIYNLEYKDEIDAILMGWLMEHTKQEVMEKAQAQGFAATALNTTEDLFADPHLGEREFWVQIDHPATGPLSYPGAPAKLSQTPWQAGRAPMLGEHNEEVLCGRLGYSKEDLVRMRERGII